MGNTFKLVHVQPFVPSSAAKSLNISILRWLARLNIQQRYLALVRPIDQRLAEVFWAIITTKSGWFASPFDNLIQSTYEAWVLYVGSTPVHGKYDKLAYGSNRSL